MNLVPASVKFWVVSCKTNPIVVVRVLVMNKAILTKDNTLRRNWSGDPSCYFCSQAETANHLLFQCSVAKTVWATFDVCIGAQNVPRNLSQCWAWCEQWLAQGRKFHTLGIASICWAIWKARNKLCFELKIRCLLFAMHVPS
jgi:hypothetical protein